MLIKFVETTDCLNKRTTDHLLQNRSTTKISSDRRCVKSISDIALILATATPVYSLGIIWKAPAGLYTVEDPMLYMLSILFASLSLRSADLEF